MTRVGAPLNITPLDRPPPVMRRAPGWVWALLIVLPFVAQPIGLIGLIIVMLRKPAKI